MVLRPVAPKLPPSFDPWDGLVGSDIELDGVSIKRVDFVGSSKLSIDASKVESAVATSMTLDRCDVADTSLVKFDGAGMRTYKSSFLRTTLTDSRLTGAEFAEAQFMDCTFHNVKLDEVGFRYASFKRVRFEDCVLRQADFSNAKLQHVVFTGCDLEGTTFGSASCTSVDITGEDLAATRGIIGLKGATISQIQLIQIAPLLAAELGFQIEGTS